MERMRIVRALLLALMLLLPGFGPATSLSTAAAPAQQACSPVTGCVQKESGTNAQWWPNTWKRGRCTGQSDRD
ncbi:MAG TPA: hypothetical protein VGE04_07055, partial [Chloroflexia bacterium]